MFGLGFLFCEAVEFSFEGNHEKPAVRCEHVPGFAVDPRLPRDFGYIVIVGNINRQNRTVFAAAVHSRARGHVDFIEPGQGLCGTKVFGFFSSRCELICHYGIISHADHNIIFYHRDRRAGDSDTIGQFVYRAVVEEIIVRGHDVADAHFTVLIEMVV